jgi:hypothetical protein
MPCAFKSVRRFDRILVVHKGPLRPLSNEDATLSINLMGENKSCPKIPYAFGESFDASSNGCRHDLKHQKRLSMCSAFVELWGKYRPEILKPWDLAVVYTNAVLEREILLERGRYTNILGINVTSLRSGPNAFFLVILYRFGILENKCFPCEVALHYSYHAQKAKHLINTQRNRRLGVSYPRCLFGSYSLLTCSPCVYISNVFVRIRPGRMEMTFLVSAFIGMSTENCTRKQTE